MRAQYLDSMDLERERGITIKAQNVRLEWNGYVVNLIDTPGHVDFGYEVSRSLAACEGVILLVDASQGIEAQTLANCYLALEHDLTIVAALNKIDLPAAEPDKRADEIERVLGIPADEVLRISAKTGEGVTELLDAVIERIPPPTGDADAPLQALIFDSYYDPYRGVVSAVRVFNGTLRTGAKLRVPAGARATTTPRRSASGSPVPTPVAALGPGEVGYLIAGIKDVGEAKVGETVTDAVAAGEPLAGYRDPKPMVFCGLYPVDGDEYARPARGAARSCGSTTRRSPTSPRRRARSASGSGAGSSGCCTWRSCASGSSASTTSRSSRPRPTSSTGPSSIDGEVEIVDNPSSMPTPNEIAAIEEPYVNVIDPHADRVRRHADGARAAAPGRDAEDGVPLRGPGRARLPPAAGARSSSTSSTR